MKKMAIFLVIGLILVFCISAFAEETDLAALSDEELLTLMNDITEEIRLRNGVSAIDQIGRGTYLVGTDIKAGTFDFVCLDTDRFDDGSPDNDIWIVENGSDDRVFWEQRFEIGAHVVFNLKEGDSISIEGCSGGLKSIEPSWAP